MIKINRIYQPEPRMCPWRLPPVCPVYLTGLGFLQGPLWGWAPTEPPEHFCVTLTQCLEKPAGSCLEGFTWFLLQAPWSEQNTGMLTSFQQSSPPRTFCYYMDCTVYWDQAVEYVFGLFTAFGDTISTHVGFQSPRTFYSHFFFLPSGETRIPGVHRPQFIGVLEHWFLPS